jgi:nucleoside-diphosphate-sugar epimerase
MQKVLVTGAAGFIGSHLTDALVQRGDLEVRALDNLVTGQRSNLDTSWKEIDFYQIDLNDAEGLRQAVAGVDTIFHQAALPSVPRSVQDPRTSHIANIEGTFNLLEAARAAGVRRIVYAASSSAYGDQPGFPRVETMRPEPISPYAVQKLTAELYLQSYFRVYGMETVCLRYFNIFGPRQAADSPYSGVVAKWITTLIEDGTPRINGDGEQGRDFTYVANAVNANLLAAEAPKDAIAGRVFNIACGERHTLNETYAMIARLLKSKTKPEYGPARAGDVKDSLASIEAARSAFGYSVTIDFEEGLRRTVEWYQQQHS